MPAPRNCRGTLHAGLAAPASVRVEAIAPFGQPVFILAGRDNRATLLMPREDSVLRDAPVATVLERLTGLALSATDLRLILTGCLSVPADPSNGRAFANGWRAVTLGSGIVAYLKTVNGTPVVVAADHGDWRVDYAQHLNGWPREVRIRSVSGDVDVTAAIARVRDERDARPQGVRSRGARHRPDVDARSSEIGDAAQSATIATHVDLVLPSYAKINLDLRMLGVRPDGYHDLKTVFQSLALHDDVTFKRRKGPFVIECDDPRIPVDERNLVWRAAALLWRTAGKRRGDTPRDVLVELRKRVPAAAGLGGGSGNAAMALLGLSRVWELDVDVPTLSRLASGVGADVPFFLVGGTALGLGRGDDIYPLPDLPRTYVVIVRPKFGVSTAEAYGWYDAEPRRTVREPARRPLPEHWPEWAFNLRNDLEPAVARHHPTIGRIKQALVGCRGGRGGHVRVGIRGFWPVRAPRRRPPHRRATWRGRAGWSCATRTASRSEYGGKAPSPACPDP